MKKYFKRKIKALLSIGIRESQTVFEARQVRTLNRISFFLGIINASLLVFNLIAQRSHAIFLNLSILLVICFPIFFLNYKFQNKAAQIYSFFASNTLILLYACYGIINNRIINYEILILGCGFFGAFLFSASWMLLSYIYNLSTYVFIAGMKIMYINAVSDSAFIGSLINCFATTSFLYLIIMVYKEDFKRAELDLSKSEDRLNLVLKGSNHGWWDWDLVKDNIYYSPVWWNTLGYEYNELKPEVKLWWNLLHPDDLPHVNELYNRALITTSIITYEVEIHLKHKAGHYIPILSKGFISRDKEGKPFRISGSNIDLTEHKKGREKLESLIKSITEKNEELSRQKSEIEIQSEKLAELNQIKDKLFSIIAHDIRSPITSLLLTLNSIKENMLTTEDLLDILPEITSNSKSILELIDNLFGWARSQLEGTKVYPTNFNLNQVISEEVKLFSSRAKDKKIKLNYDISDTLNAYADKDMIELVIRNLISNAIKFCSEGDSVYVTASIKNNSIEILVSDTGRGISPESIEKIFTSGVISSKGTLGEIGTGLGLLLCKEFTEKNNGKIAATSEPSKGSQFTFTVPSAIEKTV